MSCVAIREKSMKKNELLTLQSKLGTESTFRSNYLHTKPSNFAHGSLSLEPAQNYKVLEGEIIGNHADFVVQFGIIKLHEALRRLQCEFFFYFSSVS